MFAIIENDQVVEFPIYNLQMRFPNTSIVASDLPAGVVLVEASPPPAHDASHKAVAGSPVLSDGKWVQGWVVEPLSADEVAEREVVAAQDIRADRNQRLSSCDWTQVADAPVDQAAWAAYRQALRDITSQDGFPFSVQWPTQPA
jgi:hypothetical protein